MPFMRKQIECSIIKYYTYITMVAILVIIVSSIKELKTAVKEEMPLKCTKCKEIINNVFSKL